MEAEELLEEARAAEEEEEPPEGEVEPEEAVAAAAAASREEEEAEEGLVGVSEDVVRRQCLSSLSSYGVLGKRELFEGILCLNCRFAFAVLKASVACIL